MTHIRAIPYLALLALGLAQELLELPWLMEGGSSYREGSIPYDGAADARGAAGYFYYSLNEGAHLCTKSVPETASSTPIYFEGVWIIGKICIIHLTGRVSLLTAV